MKTATKIVFPKIENEYIENILRQLVNQYKIVQIFFTKQSAPAFSHLIIHTENSADATALQQNKWVAKAKNQYHIEVSFIYATKLHYKFSMGHPFIEWYCQSSSSIYQNEESVNPLIIKRSWKKFSKKFKVWQDNFHHEHDLHQTQLQNLIAERASSSVFTTFARLIEYDLEQLEELYIGRSSDTFSLQERIENIIPYIPEIQKYFVRKTPSQYFVTEWFTKAKEAALEDNEFYGDELIQAIKSIEQNLYCLIEERFKELRKKIKKVLANPQVTLPAIDKPKDDILETAVKILINAAEIEQIYAYHQITYGEKTTYYLMLIAHSIGNEKLIAINQSLKSIMGANYDFVLVSHSRSWIQSNLYSSQKFFMGIIQDKNLIYTSSIYHPNFHWEVPHNPYHADLYFHYKSTKDYASQLLTIAANPNENYQGLDTLFASFVLSFCRTYIFIKTYYFPNYLPSQTLWELCIYADPDIRKYNYLIEQFWTDFFAYSDKHRIVSHKITKLKKDQANCMGNIVEKLINELHELVIEGNLLSDYSH